jgi:cytochrome c5
MFCFEPGTWLARCSRSSTPTKPDNWGSNDAALFRRLGDRRLRPRRPLLVQEAGQEAPGSPAQRRGRRPHRQARQEAEAKAAGARIESGTATRCHALPGDGGAGSRSRRPGQAGTSPSCPVIGREIRIGRKTYRYGLVRFAKDPQRLYNYAEQRQDRDARLAAQGAVARHRRDDREYSDRVGPREQSRTCPTCATTWIRGAPGTRSRARPPPVIGPGAAALMQDSAEALHAVTGIYPSARSAPGAPRAAARHPGASARGRHRLVRVRQEHGPGDQAHGRDHRRSHPAHLRHHEHDPRHRRRRQAGRGQINRRRAWPSCPRAPTTRPRPCRRCCTTSPSAPTTSSSKWARRSRPRPTHRREGMTAWSGRAEHRADRDGPHRQGAGLAARRQVREAHAALLPPAIQLMEAEEEGDPSLAPKPQPGRSERAARERNRADQGPGRAHEG